jgi:hypothetical protein
VVAALEAEGFEAAVLVVAVFEEVVIEEAHLVVEEVMEDQVGDPLEERVPLEQHLDPQADLILIEGIDHTVDIIDQCGGTIDLGITVGGIIQCGQGIIIALGIILRYMLAEALYY